MRHYGLLAATTGVAILAFCASLRAQEVGPLQTFGSDGRLFSAGDNDYYLLSRRSYMTEDSSGYDGQIRQVKKYPGGGFEIKIKDYIARCNAPFDNDVLVVWFEPGEKETGQGRSVAIKRPDKFPGSATKDSYNLYWAACHGNFKKFK